MIKKTYAVWLELIRVPNLITVPGDAWVGYAAAALVCGGRWSLLPMVLVGSVVVLVYAGGLVQNDLADFDVDLRMRPCRPLPSGRVSRRSAWLLLAGLWAGAMLLVLTSADSGAALVLTVLLILVTFYNIVHKISNSLAAVLVMGACRGCGILIGAAMFDAMLWMEPLPLLLAFGLSMYIGSVTWIARRECETRKFSRFEVLFPVAAVICIAVTCLVANFVYVSSLAVMAGVPVAIMALMLVMRVAVMLAGGGVSVSAEVTQRCVGILILGLLPLQIMALLFLAQPSYELLWALLPLAFGLPLASALSRRVRMS